MSLHPANKRPTSAPKGAGVQLVFTVIGIYADNNQRFAEAYACASPAAAEIIATATHPGLIVAGVIDMRGEVVA